MNPEWNEEEIDHYTSVFYWLLDESGFNLTDDEMRDIAKYSTELLRYKRQF